MPLGTSGVAGPSHRSSDFAAADRMLDLVRNAELYQKRMEDLATAMKAADEAKKEARRIISNAKKKAEDDAKAIIGAAEEQAQDRLNAIQDLEAKTAADQQAWQEEKTSEQTKLRSDRSKAGAATKAAKDAKEAHEKARKAAEDARQAADAERSKFADVASQIRELMKTVAV